MLNVQPLTTGRSILTGNEIRAFGRGLLAAGLAWSGLQFFPNAEVELFARAAAWLASLFIGAPVARVDLGWLVADGAQPVVVSAACSATSYYVTVVALLGWRLVRGKMSALLAIPVAMVSAFPVTLLVNALRVVAVMHAHRWIIPRFPETYGAFLHMLVGVGVFLPALIGLNLILEYHGNRHPSR